MESIDDGGGHDAARSTGSETVALVPLRRVLGARVARHEDITALRDWPGAKYLREGKRTERWWYPITRAT